MIVALIGPVLLLLHVQRLVQVVPCPLVGLVLARMQTRVYYVSTAGVSLAVSVLDGVQPQVRCPHILDLAQHVGLVRLPRPLLALKICYYTLRAVIVVVDVD